MVYFANAIGDLTCNTLTITGDAVAGITKAMVALGNCDNTSNDNKPVSIATRAALGG